MVTRPQPLRLVASRPSTRPPEHDITTLVEAALNRDEAAWNALVRRFDPILRRIARTYRLSPAQVDDAVQATWLRLVRSLHTVRDPECLGGWLATAVRRESLRLLQQPVREYLTDDPPLGDESSAVSPEDAVLEAEARAILADAIATLPERHARLMTLLFIDPHRGYREISELAGVPIGSIGPIRARALDRLARDRRLRALYESEAAG